MSQKITFHQFNQLTHEEKYIILEDHGHYLKVKREDKSHTIALFYLYGFYVEVWMHREKDVLEKATAFIDYKKLDPFLPGIDISSIYSHL